MKPIPFSRPIRAIRGGAIVLALTSFVSLSCTPNKSLAAPAKSLNFDFGGETQVPSYVSADASVRFSAQSGYGWLDTADLGLRDRKNPDDLRRDFVMGKSAQTFRIIGLTPGRYQLSVVSGDMDYVDHVTTMRVAGNAIELPTMAPDVAEFLTLTATITATESLDITFASPQNNWVVNALSLQPTTADMAPAITRQRVAPEAAKSTWQPQIFQDDPTKPLLQKFREASQKASRDFRLTGLNRADYLKLITGQVDFWKKHQDANGAIIDPYKKEEIQYSTPAFASAAAILVARHNRADLLEPASKAMDWATRRLSQRQAANSHEDFYPTMIAQAFVLLKPQVQPERAARWEADIRGFDPYKTYRQAMGSMNWNIVSSSGEALFQNLGLRERTNRYVIDSFAAQGRHFTSPYGLYLEGPLAYDHFPRIFLADVIAQGYKGPYSAEISEALRRAAITSLFMQSPWGELPAGGRSAHHQWNEAEQCVTYEIYAAQALKDGDAQLAGVYKRAAHLALASMQRWVRPSGEMQIVKNWVDPAQRHAFEGYSAHSQYNLLPMAMLASAYEYAASTESLAERPAPADLGGYVFEIPELHKVFANAGGTYVELDTKGDSHYDATGLIRVHMKGVSPQLGPSDSLLSHPSYQSLAPAPHNAGIGVAWQDAAGQWQTLGDLETGRIKKVTVKPLATSPSRVAFDVTYEGDLAGVSRLIEHYVVTPGQVELTTELPGYAGGLRYLWPVLADDGRTQSTITSKDDLISVSLDGGKTTQTFRAPGAQSVRIEEPRYSNHNGWARLGVAEYPRGGEVTFVIALKK